MKNKNEDAIKIAKIIATCPSNRLKYVVGILEAGGYEVDDGLLKEAGRAGLAQMMAARYSMRKKKSCEWEETNDDDVLFLRSAYFDGINLSALSKLTGIARETIYRYMRMDHIPTPYYADALRNAINSIKKV